MSLRYACHALATLAVLVSAEPGQAEPSAALAAALNTSRPAASVPVSNPLTSITSLLRAADARFSVAIESVGDARWKLENGTVPAGTLKEQLDCLASSAGYELQANGDWLNFYPKSAGSDPNYVMNKRIPGVIDVSPTPYATSIKPWMVENGISCARELRGMRIKVDFSKIAGNRIVLKDPTLREYFNASHTVYGRDGYSVHVQTKPDPTSPGKTLTMMTEAISRLWDAPVLEPTPGSGTSQPK